MEIPDGSLVAGVPGKIKKSLSEKQRDSIKGWAEKYIEVAKAHRLNM
jgi:carbonic anhydrase/acetyltransferase-like protein (isoleucine patch superfamily)